VISSAKGEIFMKSCEKCIHYKICDKWSNLINLDYDDLKELDIKFIIKALLEDASKCKHYLSIPILFNKKELL